MNSPDSRKLALDDIADVRAYERERPAFRKAVIETKRRRRIAFDPILTLMFENRDTMRLQVQEMARVEKLVTDEAIQIEIDTYNSMIPAPGQLCATLFLELTSDDEVRGWLPKLVGIERSLLIVLPNGEQVRAITEEQHAEQLTREEATAAVHYIRFEFTPDQVESFAAGPVRIEIDHPEYRQSAEMTPEMRTELLVDLLP
ncbi:MAG: DUF3501 family protein [Ilumatobacteraceae bacterium]|nr:DUF3501 family protein [Ilumatobacteraceae bacterium]